MTKPTDLYWADGTFKTRNNAFNLNCKPSESLDISKDVRSALQSAEASRRVDQAAREGRKLASLHGLSKRPQQQRYSPPIVGRIAGEAQRDKTAAIKKASI